MSDFLNSLIQRSLGTEPALQPRLASRFEPLRQAPSLNEGVGSLEESSAPNLDMRHQPSLPSASPSIFDSVRGMVPSVDPVESRPLAGSQEQSFHSPSSDRSSTPLPTIHTETPSPRTPRASANESPLTPRSDRWIIQRMDELSSELQQLRGSHSPQSLAAPSIELPQIHIERPREGSSNDGTSNDAPLLSAASSVNDDRAADRPLLQSESPASAISVLEPRQKSTSRDEMMALLAESRMQPVPKIAPEPLPSVSKYSAPPQPTINVTIGRVEVKATRDAAPQPRQTQPKSSPSVMSLQDYLARRAAGGLP
jgi:hypothetical protein